MTRARILHLVSTDLNYDQRVDRISGSLTERYDVSVLGHEKATSLPLSDHPAHRARVRTASSSGPRFYYEMNRSMIAWARDQSYDLIVSNDLDTLWAGSQIARATGAKLGIDAHEYFTEVPELMHKPVRRAIWTRLARTYLPLCSLKYTCTTSLGQALGDKYGDKWGLVRNMPRSSTESLPITKREHFTVIYQGAINQGRGVELMLAALKQFPAMRLVVAGEGDLSDSMRELARSYGVEDQVEFAGYILPSELHKLTRECHVGINLLSGTSDNYKVSLANKFFDYVHAEIPGIHMAFPEYKRMIAEYEVGVMCDEYRVESLVVALDRLRDDAVRATYRASCVQAKELWNWEIERDRMWDLYASIL